MAPLALAAAFSVTGASSLTRTGDFAEADVIAPIALSVPDAPATERLRAERRRHPVPVFRHCPDLAQLAEARLAEDFARGRAWFVGVVEKSYGRRTLNRATVNHSSFARFVHSLGGGRVAGTAQRPVWSAQGDHPALPLSMELAGQWALGESGEDFLRRWTERLRKAAQSHLCSEPVDATIRSCFEADTVLPQRGRVVPVKSFKAPLHLEQVHRRATEAKITEFDDLGRARQALAGSFSGSERMVGAYLAGLLQPNTLLDVALTRAASEEQANKAVANRTYKRGELILRKGEIVDDAARLALALIEEHQRNEQRKAALAEARHQLLTEMVGSVWRRFTTLSLALGALVQRHPWPVVAFCGGVSVLILLRRARNRRTAANAAPPMSYTVMINPNGQETIFLPVRSSSEPLVVAAESARPEAPAESSLSGWREQVTEAERRAEDLLARVRAGLAPELARQMMDRLVQQLLAQRQSWLTTCTAATEHVAALEHRFTTLHDTLRQQLQTHETRASLLQQKLASKDLENSELWRAVVDAQKKRSLEAQK